MVGDEAMTDHHAHDTIQALVTRCEITNDYLDQQTRRLKPDNADFMLRWMQSTRDMLERVVRLFPRTASVERTKRRKK